jgi:hypothetical protein
MARKQAAGATLTSLPVAYGVSCIACRKSTGGHGGDRCTLRTGRPSLNPVQDDAREGRQGTSLFLNSKLQAGGRLQSLNITTEMVVVNANFIQSGPRKAPGRSLV